MPLAMRFLTTRAQITANGRIYGAVGGVADVPVVDASAVATDQGWPLMWVGTTSDRPVYDVNRIGWPPLSMYDDSLSKPIFQIPASNPVQWVDITGTAV
jgi:hypothetical protein